jgi:hypothetical protein
MKRESKFHLNANKGRLKHTGMHIVIRYLRYEPIWASVEQHDTRIAQESLYQVRLSRYRMLDIFYSEERFR